jgi:hypothetical protein
MTKRVIWLMVVLAAFAAACGDDTETASEAGSVDEQQDNRANDPDDDSTADSGGAGTADAGDSGCPAQGFTGTVSRMADGDNAAAEFDGNAVWTEGVVAARLVDGGHYTVYASDHEYIGAASDFDTIVAAPGGTVATLSFGLGSGYTAGEAFAYGDEGATVVVIIDSGGGASGSANGAAGTVTPLGWNDDWVCFDLDYADDTKAVSGQISAPVVGGF